MTGKMLVPKTMNEAIKFSKMLAASSMVPKQFQGKPEDILVAVQWGSEVGLPIMSALQNIAVINGKPTIYGDAALALVTAHPQYGGHQEWLDGETAHCRITRLVNAEKVDTERTFSVGEAKRAGLLNKAGPWQQYPNRMLQMRARGFAIRDAFPDALKGVGIDENKGSSEQTAPENPLDAAFGGDTIENDPPGEPPVQVKEAQIPKVPEEAETPPAPSEAPESRVWELTLDDDVIECLDADMWYGEFIAAIGRAANEEGISLNDRRHNASVIKKANDDTIERLSQEREALGADIKDRYKKLIKTLSAKAKDEESRA